MNFTKTFLTRTSGIWLIVLGVFLIILQAILSNWFPNIDGFDICGALIAVLGLIIMIARWKH